MNDDGPRVELELSAISNAMIPGRCLAKINNNTPRVYKNFMRTAKIRNEFFNRPDFRATGYETFRLFSINFNRAE